MPELPPRTLTVDTREFDPQTVVIGRAGWADFAIDDDYVSNRHVSVRRNAVGVITIEDEGSTNGFYFNGRRVPLGERVVVNPPGGILRIGHTEIHVELVDDWMSRVISDTVPEDNERS